jgi:hypothetical protein
VQINKHDHFEALPHEFVLFSLIGASFGDGKAGLVRGAEMKTCLRRWRAKFKTN